MNNLLTPCRHLDPPAENNHYKHAFPKGNISNYCPYTPGSRLPWLGGSKKYWLVTNCYCVECHRDDFFFFFACLPDCDADPNASIADSPWFHLWSSNGNSFSGLMKKTNSAANKFLMLVYKHIFYLNATLQCNCHLNFFFFFNYLYYYLLASSRVLMLQVFKFGVKTITILQQIFHSYKFFCVLCLPTARLMIVQLSRSDSLPVCGWW